MINTTKYIISVQQKSDDVFRDILLPMSNRKSLNKNKSNILPVYFYRYIGLNGTREEYDIELLQLDAQLSTLGNKYLRYISGIKRIESNDFLNKVIKTWSSFSGQPHNEFEKFIEVLKLEKVLPTTNIGVVDATLTKCLGEILNLFVEREENVNETILKNFTIKILVWIHEYVPKLFSDCNEENILSREFVNPKVLYYGAIKKHEVYFLIYLSRIGCDVLYINSLEDVELQNIDFKNEYSQSMYLLNRKQIGEFPKPKELKKPQPQTEIIKEIATNKTQPLIRKIERDFEDLAKLSDSIVMIKTYDNGGEFLGSGSGIIIDHSGLICTNLHVLKEGTYFEVIFEGMSEGLKYQTYTLVNSDPKRDLALISIKLKTKPIDISSKDEVRRGQRVVAIGSPLGLMNTFSDGIISGFRNIGTKDFIQTTAPISPGSSGGALLNMYGELIGITSAGYIDGQNINLAIPTKDLLVLLNQKWTILNREIINKHSIFQYHGKELIFDCFFRCGSLQNYKVTLYQCNTDSEFCKLFNDMDFRGVIESYYIEQFKNTIENYDIIGYDFEIGGGNHIFTYRYDRGILSNSKWLKLK